MEFDSTFWVAISFVIFFGVLIYFKIPRKINEALDTKISEIKNELDESEKLRIETKKLLEDSQSKLSSAVKESKKIIDQAKNDSEKMVSELELKFENSAKIKKELSLSKIKQMKDEAVREIKNTSVDVAFSALENLIKNLKVTRIKKQIYVQIHHAIILIISKHSANSLPICPPLNLAIEKIRFLS